MDWRPQNFVCTESGHKENLMKTKAMDDLDDLTESCEAASESPELPYPSSEDVLLLITQLQADCKDSFSLLKIRKAVQSYKRLIELKIRCCELLRRQIEKMEDKVTGLQKELSETKELKLQLEHEKVEQEQELCNARFALKQEKEKREKADWLLLLDMYSHVPLNDRNTI
ncbi:ankyrin repeat domain-containing protein 26 [Fukomys damarensis]|uniref:ankyrin repeat domain-containing protein 26 n=1 Tax=Fukomys damarensis TaxID=885580 RepID=UPI0008FF5696|nr:ankyrin repeat domain-containing protein 26 [Fukomys damarensis]